MDNNEEAHVCEENLDANCRCKICGRVCHNYVDDDDSTFAASGKIATARCTRCGNEERYYSDTGTIVG